MNAGYHTVLRGARCTPGSNHAPQPRSQRPREGYQEPSGLRVQGSTLNWGCMAPNIGCLGLIGGSWRV